MYCNIFKRSRKIYFSLSQKCASTIELTKKNPTHLSFFREIDTNLHKFCEVVELSAIGDDCFEEHFVLVLDAYFPKKFLKKVCNKVGIVRLRPSNFFRLTAV